jgi:hypothetical protein
VIEVGEQIEWRRGEKARHIRCPVAPKTAAKSQRRVEAVEAASDVDALARCGDATAVIAQPRKERDYISYHGARRVGEIVRANKGYTLVIATEASYYHSEDACEDNDCFCGHYGRHYPYRAVVLSTCAAQAEEEAEAAAKRAEIEAKKRADAEAERAWYAGIPVDYCESHGAEGGAFDVRMTSAAGETVTVHQDAPVAPPAPIAWEEVARWGADRGGYAHVGYAGTLPDGRPVYRESICSSDDWRVSHYLPRDLWLAMARAEAAALTPEQVERGEEFVGCVGGEITLLALGREEEALERVTRWSRERRRS